MKAKTYADLGGLFADLPRTDAEAAEAPREAARQRYEHRYARVLLLAVITVVAVIVAVHTLVWPFTSWVWLLLLGAILYATMIRKRS